MVAGSREKLLRWILKIAIAYYGAIRIYRKLPSARLAALRETAFVYIGKRIGPLVNHDAVCKVENDPHNEDVGLAKHLSMVARLASQDVHYLCIPVSRLARWYLARMIKKIRSGVTSTNPWWLRIGATDVRGDQRARRLVSRIISEATHAHNVEDTPVGPAPDGPHVHSGFRKLAQSFRVPGASQSDINNTQSNHQVAGASRNVGVGKTRRYLENNAFKTHDLSKSSAARDELASGIRDVNDVKDLLHIGPSDEYETGAVLTLVDDDMYRDSLALIAGANALIVTPSYNKCAGVGTDSTWWYTTDTKGNVSVVERVASVNGAVYSNQRPWNYAENDFVYITHASGDAFTTYNVVIKHQPGTHHMWVWLARNTTTWISKDVCDLMKTLVGDTGLNAVELRKAANVICITPADALAKLPKATGEQKERKAEIARLFGGPNPRNFIVGLFGTGSDPIFSIKYADSEGPNSSVEITENEYREFCHMGNSGKSKGFGVSEIKRTMLYMGNWRKGSVEPIIAGYFLIPIDYRPRPNIMYVRQDGSVDDDTDGRETAVWAAPNPTNTAPGVADTTSEQAHIAYKEKRLEEFANKIEPSEDFKHLTDMLLMKFISLISKETGVALKSKALPSAKIIHETRTGAAQAARLERWLHNNAKETVPRSNLKSETAAKASVAPRCITQYPEGLSIQTGRLGLLIKEILSGCSFYMPGKTPTEIARAIRSLTEFSLWKDELGGAFGLGVTGLHDTDYTKMDETISEFIYGWFKRFVLAFVSDGDMEEVKQILDDNVNFKSQLFNIMIKTGYKNNSGSGVTTALNTFLCAFLDFLANTLAIVRHATSVCHKDKAPNGFQLNHITRSTVRKHLEKYQKDLPLQWMCSRIYGCDHLEIQRQMEAGKALCSILDMYTIPYFAIGLKFGDDGVGAHLPYITDGQWSDCSQYVTQTIGMILKATFTSPESGTFFLGRRYPAPTKTLASYADVIKAIAKLSVARNSDVSKYTLKLRGYWTTDSRTPGIREYLIAVSNIYGIKLAAYEATDSVDEDGSPVLSDEMFNLLVNDKDMFYRVIDGPYEVDDSDVPVMLASISHELGFSNCAELEEWLQGMAACNTWDQLDEYLLPGEPYNPDNEPHGTRRTSGVIKTLLEAATNEATSTSPCDEPEQTSDELITSAALALQYLLRERNACMEDYYNNRASQTPVDHDASVDHVGANRLIAEPGTSADHANTVHA